MQAPRVDPAEQARLAQIEQEQVAMMSPAQVAQYYAQKSEQNISHRLQQMQFGLQEQADRTAFGVLQQTNPLARKYAAEVEKVVAEQLRNGMTVRREVALKYVVGEKMMERAAAAGTRQGKAAAARVTGATVKPGRGNGDASSDRGGRRGGDPSEAELERRLGSVKF